MLTEEQKEMYYQNIRSMVVVENKYSYQDLDDERVEDFINKESNRIFRAIFEEEY